MDKPSLPSAAHLWLISRIGSEAGRLSPRQDQGAVAGFEQRQYRGAEALARAAAEQWITELRQGDWAPQGSYTVALSGGRFAASFFDAVVQRARESGVSWRPVQFFFADERCVPLGHPDSNYRLAHEHLFLPLGIPAEQVCPLVNPEDGAERAIQAQERLQRTAHTVWRGQPVVDLVVLGMGEDGHVASLFPGAPPDLLASQAVYAPVVGPKPPPRRVTLTYAALAVARQVWVLVSGAGKTAALANSLGPRGTTPLARVLQSRQSRESRG